MLCFNQQLDRTEIRNARSVLSLSFNLSSKMILDSEQITVVIFKRINVKF